MCVHRGRQSYLTIAEVDFSMNGGIVLCRSTNIVEGEEHFKETSVSLKVLGKQHIGVYRYRCQYILRELLF